VSVSIVERIRKLRSIGTVDVIYCFCTPLGIGKKEAGSRMTTPESVLRSLIAQIVDRNPALINRLCSEDQELLASALNSKLRLSRGAFWDSLNLLIRAKSAGELNIVLDRLDAIRPSEERILFVDELRKFLDAFLQQPAATIKVLVTSLPHAPISDAFAGLPFIDPATEVSGQ
jgi:hypothetical protein